MVTECARMVSGGNYTAEWGDIVPRIKVRNLIPCVVNIFPRGGGGGLTDYELPDCKAIVILHKFVLFSSTVGWIHLLTMCEKIL